MSRHLCGVLPGSRVLCYEVHANTGSMHCDRTATGKDGFFRQIFSKRKEKKLTCDQRLVCVLDWSTWGKNRPQPEKETLPVGFLKIEDEV